MERAPSPPRGPPENVGGGAAFIPPMPYEPAVGGAAGVTSPPPPQVMTHDRGVEAEPVFIPPMPYEPADVRSPHLPMDMGGEGAVPYNPAMGGGPPPFPAAHYGLATVSS